MLTGFPPKVLKYRTFRPKASSRSGLPTSAAIGRPFPMGLPSTTRSGSDFVALEAPPAARTPESGLHLIGEVERAVGPGPFGGHLEQADGIRLQAVAGED